MVLSGKYFVGLSGRRMYTVRVQCTGILYTFNGRSFDHYEQKHIIPFLLSIIAPKKFDAKNMLCLPEAFSL